MSDVWALRLFRAIYCAFIVFSSVTTIMKASGESHAVYALAVPEILAALAFLIVPFEIAACAVLLIVYAAAAALSIASGDLFPLRLLYYAATAVFIVSANRRQRAHSGREAI